jgi:DNA-binding transcriptional ArsR family regulator
MKNLAKKNNNENPNTLRVEKTAGQVSGELDKVIHDRTRLGITSALAANDKLSFTELKHLLNTSDGNISVHTRKLEEAGYVVCEKSFKGRMPLTEYSITKAGRGALQRYLDHMEALIKAMKRQKYTGVRTGSGSDWVSRENGRRGEEEKRRGGDGERQNQGRRFRAHRNTGGFVTPEPTGSTRLKSLYAKRK